MNYSEQMEKQVAAQQVTDAIVFATNAHRNQYDKTGHLFILHPLRVMNAVAHIGTREMIVAVLHDVVEDTKRTIEDIQCVFGKLIADSVDAISRREDETYRKYVERCKLDPVARIVKIADVLDNASPARYLPELKGLHKRYELSIDILTDGAHDLKSAVWYLEDY